MGPFFQFILAESWGFPGMLRMPSGFEAWRLFAHGLQTLSRLLNARALHRVRFSAGLGFR